MLLSGLILGKGEKGPCWGGGGVDGVEGRLYIENIELILLRNGKFYSLDKIHG